MNTDLFDDNDFIGDALDALVILADAMDSNMLYEEMLSEMAKNPRLQRVREIIEAADIQAKEERSHEGLA